MSRPPGHRIQVVDGDCMIPSNIACALMGITTGTLTAWMKSDDPPPYDHGARAYPARALGEWMRSKQIVRKGVGGQLPYLPATVVIAPRSTGGLPSALPEGGKKDYNYERTRKERAMADKTEMENEITRGTVVSMAEVERAWSKILSNVKTRMMQIPYTAASIVTGDNDMTSVQSKIKDVVKDALLELSGDWRGDDDEDEE